MANFDPGAGAYAPPAPPPTIVPATAPAVIRDPQNAAWGSGYAPPPVPLALPAWNPSGPSLDPGLASRLATWGQPAAAPMLPPPTLPLSDVYAPVARAYQRGGPMGDFADQPVVNPAYTAAQTQAQDRTPTGTDLGYAPPKFIYGPGGEVRGIEGRAPAAEATGTAARLEQATASAHARAFFSPLEPITRGLSAGQSALDLITVHADALLPGPGQGTLKNRYDEYISQGLPADKAANATMRDYGDALKTLAETQSAGVGARVGAQAARLIGLAQSVTAPAPVPGDTGFAFAVGALRRGEGAAFEAALGALKAGDRVVVAGKEGIVDAVRGAKVDIRFGGDEIAKVTRAKDIEEILPKTAAAIGADQSAIAAKLAQAEQAPLTKIPLRASADAAAQAAGYVPKEDVALTEEALRRVQNLTKGLTPEESAAIGFGGAKGTKTEIKNAEQRILELQRESAVTGGKPVDVPPVTHGAGGNEPTRGFQIEKFPPEVQGFMQQIAKGLDPALAAATKTLSHQDITTAAQLIGEPVAKVADRLAKRGVSSAEIQMVRQGVAMKVNVAQTLAAKVSKGLATPAEMYDALSALQEAAAIQRSLHEAASEAGRTLGILRSEIDPVLAANPSHLAYMAAISRIARSPDQAAALMDGLLKVGNDPDKVYALLRSLNKPTHTDELLSLWNLPRALKASFDLSAAGRQGLILSAAHPGLAASAFDAQIRAFRSETFARSIDRAIRTSPMQPLRQRAGLALTEVGPTTQISQREEAFLTNLAGRIPGLRASERAYVTYLNKLRADSFDQAITGWERAGVTVTDKRAKLLADWVNIATGRGVFPQWAQGSATLLNGIFFSPRFAVSRFQALGFVPTQAAKAGFHALRGEGARAADEIAVAQLAAKDLTAFTGANLALLGLAAKSGADIELDPRSAEFGKIRVGDTLIDTWGGEQQVFRNVAQLITGEKKTVTGKNRGQIVPIARNEVVGRFLESKLSPSAGTLWDLGKLVPKGDQQAAEGAALWDKPIGVDFVGNTFSAKDLVTSTGSSMFIPMSWSDVKDAVDADREAGGTGVRGGLLGSLSLLGLGVSTYSTDEARGASPKARTAGPDVNPFHR